MYLYTSNVVSSITNLVMKDIAPDFKTTQNPLENQGLQLAAKAGNLSPTEMLERMIEMKKQEILKKYHTSPIT